MTLDALHALILGVMMLRRMSRLMVAVICRRIVGRMKKTFDSDLELLFLRVRVVMMER
jgi:hypothetical protein